MINMTLSGVKKSDTATAGVLLEKLFFFSQKNTCVRASLTIKFQTSTSAWQFIKKTPWHTCFPVNFAKFLRTPILENITGWALPQNQSCTGVLQNNFSEKISKFWRTSVTFSADMQLSYKMPSSQVFSSKFWIL